MVSISSKSEVFEFSGGGVGGRKLHLTFDAHFRIQMSYSSEKSRVKIWFGLVEIGGMLILSGGGGGEAEAPYYGGYM